MAKLAPALSLARDDIDSRWPGRDRSSDGWIGDAAHQGRVSDHNPNARGIVDALDVDTSGGATPVHEQTIVAGFIRGGGRVNYVIHNRRIYQANQGFRPQEYVGINPHTEHCHCSIKQNPAAENDTGDWRILRTLPTWADLLRQGAKGRDVGDLQAYLNAWGGALVVDEDFGPATAGAVRAFQAAHHIGVDAIVGPITRGKLFG